MSGKRSSSRPLTSQNFLPGALTRGSGSSGEDECVATATRRAPSLMHRLAVTPDGWEIGNTG